MSPMHPGNFAAHESPQTDHGATTSLEAPVVASAGHLIERRRAVRVEMPFLATVRGLNTDGLRFRAETRLDNMSAWSLYMKLHQEVKLGTRLLIVVLLSNAAGEVQGPRVVFWGRVVRVDAHASGGCGVAVEFSRHRFLYGLDA